MNASDLRKKTDEINIKNNKTFKMILTKCIEASKLGNYTYGFDIIITNPQDNVEFSETLILLKDYGYAVTHNFSQKSMQNNLFKKISIKISWK